MCNHIISVNEVVIGVDGTLVSGSKVLAKKISFDHCLFLLVSVLNLTRSKISISIICACVND